MRRAKPINQRIHRLRLPARRRPTLTAGMMNVAVHIPLDVGDGMPLEQTVQAFEQVVADLLPGQVEDILMPR